MAPAKPFSIKKRVLCSASEMVTTDKESFKDNTHIKIMCFFLETSDVESHHNHTEPLSFD
jgi:hypothetical protein